MKSTRRDSPRHSPAVLAVCLIVAITSGFLAGCSLEPGNRTEATEATFEQARVSSVVDGDTVVLEDGSRVRYLGIDTPEIGEYYYEEATERNRDLVEGRVVELQRGSRDIDEYGRLLRYIYADGVFVNAELVADGYAEAYRKGPDERYSQVLFMLEEYAQIKGAGLWSGQGP